jgi:hypothetical protein
MSFLCAVVDVLILCNGPQYRPVKIGGGGYVAGIVATPRAAVGTPHTFFRTDVGGCYRLMNTSDRSCEDGCSESIEWKPLSQRFTHAEQNWFGGDALAASHLNTSHVWMAAGAYFEHDEVGAGVFASVDAGDSWRLVSPVGWDVYAGSNNSTYRSSGERLAVHPRNESVLLYGSYLSGMWRTDDAHATHPTWKQVSCGEIPCGGAPDPGLPIGAVAIVFDSASPGGNYVYGSVPGEGIYLSTDAGVRWTLELPSPRFAHRLALAPGVMLYAAAADGVWRRPLHSIAATHAAGWEHLAQPMGAVEFRGIDVDPFDPLHVVALTHVTDPPYGMIRSRDGGSSWTVLGTYRKDYQLGWWANKDNFGDNFTEMNYNCTVRVFQQKFTHEDAIGSPARFKRAGV